MTVKLGIIGGSGIGEMAGLEGAEHISATSSYGTPSSDILTGTLQGIEIAFLARHGKGHIIPPHKVNYRANIDALKRIGVTDILSLSAVGSLQEQYAPGSFVIIDQYIDRTIQRQKTFFDEGCVGHVAMGTPICLRLNAFLAKACKAVGVKLHNGGTYLAMEGPQFSTRAESELYRSWNCDIIGMTNMPEAKLAREAEICYAGIGMVTDYDCWRARDAEVDVSAILEILGKNAAHAQQLVKEMASLLSPKREICEQGCDRALEYAILTPPEARNKESLKRLEAVAGRVL